MATLTPKPLLQGTLLPNAVAVQYTVPALTVTTVRSITICNTDSVAHTVTLHLVPSGGSPSKATMVLSAVPLDPGETLFPVGQDLWNLATGDMIQAFADAASQVSMRVDGSELV
jgi:hypothetical protein